MRQPQTPSKGDRTRQRIVEAAAPIFNREGFAGASMHEVMEAAGLEKGGVYRHFSGKEELALAAFDYAWNRVSANRTRDVETIADPLLRLVMLIHNFAERKGAMEGGCPLLNTAIDSDDGNAALRARAHAALEEWRLLLQSLLEQAKRQRKLRRDVEERGVAELIIATLEGSLMISRLEGNGQALQNARDHLIDYLDTLRA